MFISGALWQSLSVGLFESLSNASNVNMHNYGSVLLESFAKPFLGCLTGLVWQKIQEPRLQTILLGLYSFDQDGKLYTTMNISSRLVDLATKVTLYF